MSVTSSPCCEALHNTSSVGVLLHRLCYCITYNIRLCLVRDELRQQQAVVQLLPEKGVQSDKLQVTIGNIPRKCAGLQMGRLQPTYRRAAVQTLVQIHKLTCRYKLVRKIGCWQWCSWSCRNV